MAIVSKHLLLASSILGLLTEARPSARPGHHKSLIRPPWETRDPAHHKSLIKPPWETRDVAYNNGSCTSPESAPIVSAPQENIWKGLSDDEVIGLLDWLYDPKNGLNLTANDKAGPWDNTIGVTELLAPNKTDALAYLDGGGPLPPRNARVGVFFGATEEPYMQNFIVGPIPVSNKTTIAPLDYIYSKGVGKMPNYAADSALVSQYQKNVTASIADITLDLLGVTVTGAEDDGAYLYGLDPVQKEGDKIIDWVAFFVNPTEGYDDGTILLGGMWIKFDITGRDPQKWSCLGVLYNNIFYDSIADLRAAWERPDFERLTKTVDGEWAGAKRRGEELPYETLPPPTSVNTANRYAVDKDNRYVSWMDFTFYLAFDRDNGLRFHNLKYKDERIIYELGVQEAHAHYAGNDPTQSGTSYLDSYYGFGSSAFPLVPGWDCPTYATYLDTVIHDTATTTVHPGSICIFEQDAGFPLARHTSLDYVTVSKNTQLVVRWIATVGNYDYFMDYVFSLDGTIEVKVRASGYIQGAYYANNEEYGYKIHDALSGSMHDHIINYKLDMDINGTANSFEQVNIVPTTTNYTWLKEQRNTMKIERRLLETEDEGKIKWAPNSGAMYVVVNKESLNPYGEYRGYRIAPNLGSPIYLTIQNSSVAQLSNRFATHNMFVTKQKDTEPRSAAAWNNQDPYDPLVNFDTFFDGESLDQEDLVVWFNLGMHHVPHTGDLPNTVFTTAQSGISISPHNFLLGDPSRQSSHVAFINNTSTEPTQQSYGGQSAACAFKMESLNPDLSSYPVTNATRKWPQVFVGGGS